MQRPRQVQHGREKRCLGPACAMRQLSLFRHAHAWPTVEWESRAMPGPSCRELWCQQDPFSGRKRGACCHKVSAAYPTGVRVTVPQPLQSLTLLLRIPCSWPAPCPPSAGNSCGGQVFAFGPGGCSGWCPPRLPASAPERWPGGPTGICTSMGCGGVRAPAESVQGGADLNPPHSSLQQLLLSLQMFC